MQRRRIVVAAVVVVAAGAAVAFTLPSMASTTPAAAPAASQASGGGLSPHVLAAMKRDLGLDADHARARLARGDWASGVSSRLAAQTGSSFGGAWLAADGTTLKIATTDAADEPQIEAAGAVPVLVKHSEQQLDTAKQQLDAVRTTPAGLTGWYVDDTTNKVVIVAKPGSTTNAKRLARQAGLPTAELTVTTSDTTPRPEFDVRGADAYFISLPDGTARCSIGFAVQGGFVTAGHCGTPGDVTAGFNEQAQGVVKASTFPGDADMGFVAVNGNWTPRPVVNDYQGDELSVAGSTEAPVGAAVCRSGSTTGTHCGTIEAKDQTVVYPEGSVTGLTRTNVCAEPGDSGGPWLSGDQAQGVTSGGSGDCTAGGETFFQPINEILAADKLTLLTTASTTTPTSPASSPATTAPTAPATTAPTAQPTGSAGSGSGGTGTGSGSAQACGQQAVERQGSLSQAGTGQVQPRGGAFRSNAGQQTACLDAPAGADFALALQRFSGHSFHTVAAVEAGRQLSFTGRSGTYRYVVVDRSGSGAYTLGFTTP